MARDRLDDIVCNLSLEQLRDVAAPLGIEKLDRNDVADARSLVIKELRSAAGNSLANAWRAARRRILPYSDILQFAVAKCVAREKSAFSRVFDKKSEAELEEYLVNAHDEILRGVRGEGTSRAPEELQKAVVERHRKAGVNADKAAVLQSIKRGGLGGVAAGVPLAIAYAEQYVARSLFRRAMVYWLGKNYTLRFMAPAVMGGAASGVALAVLAHQLASPKARKVVPALMFALVHYRANQKAMI